MIWQPIDTAPKDVPIWVWHDPDSDPYYISPGRLTPYAAWADGAGTMDRGGYAAVWGGGYRDEHHEYGVEQMPDWWMMQHANNWTPLAPTHWMPLPEPPK